MFRLNNLLLFFFIFFLNAQQLSANDKIAFINLEKILSSSYLGKSLLKEIQNQNNENNNELKKNEIELKNDQDQLNKIKNIISEDEYKNKLNLLEQKINNFRNKKNQMVEEIEQKRNLELENFFSKINPIIQEYMNKNSIDILFDQKNVFIGKSSSDITDLLIEEINKKFN